MFSTIGNCPSEDLVPTPKLLLMLVQCMFQRKRFIIYGTRYTREQPEPCQKKKKKKERTAGAAVKDKSNIQADLPDRCVLEDNR
jgi:hypothetical protein